MTDAEIAAQIHEFLATNFLFDPDAPLDPAASLLENGVVDSTGMLEVIQFLEATFDIRISDLEVLPENLDSVQNLTQFVIRKQGGAAVHAA